MTASRPSTPAIAIVRHGETDWNSSRRIQGRTDIPLNDTGRSQAAETGRLLMSLPVRDTWGDWRSAVSSPLARAHETARIIASTLRLPAPGVETELFERDFGPAEGLPVAEAHERWPRLEVPGAEPFEALAARAATTFERLLDETPGTIVVAHGTLIRAGLSLISGSEVPRVLNGEVWILNRETAGFAASRLGGPPAN